MNQPAATKRKEALPLDARLLSDAVIELNISRRNVAIYPRGHSLVQKSLDRAYEFLQELFELRSEITLAVAKDILIVDDRFLDKRHPVFREFALSLNRHNVSSVTFIKGLSKKDIYGFQRFLSDEVSRTSRETLQEALERYEMTHVAIEFIDFGAFSFKELNAGEKVSDDNLWEDYIFGLVNGSLCTTEGTDHSRGVLPSTLAKLANRSNHLKEETYDRVISLYLRRSSEKSYSGSDLKKLTDYINNLSPEVKKQFLTSAVTNISGKGSNHSELIGSSVDDVIALLRVINEQKMAIPPALKNLLNKLSILDTSCHCTLPSTKGLSPEARGNMAGDVLVSPDIINLISGSHFSTYVTDEYQHQIDHILHFDASVHRLETPEELHREWSDEAIESSFNQVIFELITSGLRCVIPPKDHEYYIGLLKKQAEKLVCSCSFSQILNMIHIFQSEVKESDAPGIGFYVLEHLNSGKFIDLLVSSFRMMDRKSTPDALLLCEYYSQKIVSPLIEALIEEETQRNRKFLMVLISHLGDKAYSELVNHLSDKRWFVQRNMLYMLGKYPAKEIEQVIRPYANHENKKVRFQAIKILLNIGDSHGIAALRDLLKSKDRDSVVQAIELAGLFKVQEIVPELLLMLRKTARTGADLSDKIPIVKTLGMIGDSRVLDTIKWLLATKSLLFKSTLQKLKEEIYASFDNYPSEDVGDLVKKRSMPCA